MAGLSNKELGEVWQKVKENHTKLNNCVRHKFEGTVNSGRKLQCVQCGGEMDLIHVRYYCLGYAAALGDPKDIWTHFR